MDVKKTLQQLVDEVANMIIGQFLLGLNDAVKVTLHQIKHDVDILKQHAMQNARGSPELAVSTISIFLTHTLNFLRSVGLSISLMDMIFSCLKCFRILISLYVRFARVSSSRMEAIFFIATFSPLLLSTAEQTTPYAPGKRSTIRASRTSAARHLCYSAKFFCSNFWPVKSPVKMWKN